MQPLSADDIRASFVNCTKGEAGRLPLQRDLAAVRWDRLDFLGWSDPGAPTAAYVVAPGDDGPTGLVLRVGSGRLPTKTSNMCSLCSTIHPRSDVSLMVAPRAGRAGREGNTVGTYLCSDLACSAYVRGLKRPVMAQPEETLTLEQKVARLDERLGHFVCRVTS